MPFKNLRKAASSFFPSKKSTTTCSASDEHTMSLLRLSVDTIRPTATQLGRSSSLDTVRPIICFKDVNSSIINTTGEQGREKELHDVDEWKTRELEEWAKELRHREQMYPPPKLDDEEYVIEIKAGYIRTSRRRLALWNRGWVNLDTWLEDEIKKMEEDPEYQPMGCGW